MTKRPNDIAELLRNLKDSDVEVLSFDGYYDNGNGRAVVTPEPKKSQRGKRTEVDGIKFDSQHEAYRYVHLKQLEQAGHISELECHPSFVVQEEFKRDGVTYGAITYEADFSYMQDGFLFIEDVKGTKWDKRGIKKLFRIERDSKLRMKMFIKQYVDDKIIFRVVDKYGTSHPLRWK